MKKISFDDFNKIDIRTGRVERVEKFPGARKPAYKLWIDFGKLGVKKSSAQITDLYSPEDIAGRTVLAVVNFEPKQVADFMSEVLVLGVVREEGDVVLIGPDRVVLPGLRVS